MSTITAPSTWCPTCQRSALSHRGACGFCQSPLVVDPRTHVARLAVWRASAAADTAAFHSTRPPQFRQ